MKFAPAAALAGLAMASTPTLGADLFGTAPPPMTFQANQSPLTEVGSNWYLRGDVGYGSEYEPTVVPSAGLIPAILTDPGTGATYVNAPNGDAAHNVGVTRGFDKTSLGATFDLGFGYRVNDFLRLEATYAYWGGPGLSYSHGSLCPSTTAAASNMVVIPPATTATAVPVGYLWEPAACTGYLHATQHNNLVLGSAYLDLGTFWGFTPYVGVGAGLNANTISGTTSIYNNADGSPFLGNTLSSGAPNVWVVQTGVNSNNQPVYTPLSTQPKVDFATQNWNRSFTSTHYSMAGALMAGVGYQLSPSATLDIGYQYLSADLFGSNKSTFQQFRIGVRYMAN
jgi:opacity protein-like surface antigen